MQQIAFNGRFLTVAPTGVHRVAHELIAAFDKLMLSHPDRGAIPAATLLAPKSADKTPVLAATKVEKRGRLSGLAKEIPWEQFDLPWLSRNALLVNLCNLGPALHRNSVTMIHDAQVHITPQSYSRGFRLWYKFIQPLLGRTSRRILTVSEYSKAELVRYGIAPADKITVIHNGCDHVLAVEPAHGFVAESGLKRGRYVLALSTSQAHKNIRVLLEAFASERLADMTLVLFGSETRDGFESKGLHVPPNVHFAGRVTDAELAALMVHACAFACPSTTEGFGLPPLEAMALGCPAIAAPCGALPEVLGDAALMASPDEAASWVQQIRRLADDEEFSQKMRRKGRERSAGFTWEAAARELAVALGMSMFEAKAAPQPPQREEARQAAACVM